MFYMDLINLGPIRISFYNDSHYRNFRFNYQGEHGLVTGGQLGVRSQHLTLAKGEDNKDDTFVCPRLRHDLLRQIRLLANHCTTGLRH